MSLEFSILAFMQKQKKLKALKLAFFYELNLITVMPVCIKVKIAAMKPYHQNQKFSPLYQIQS